MKDMDDQHLPDSCLTPPTMLPLLKEMGET
jgi:hypothetical protein